jgi:hypothetical protein
VDEIEVDAVADGSGMQENRAGYSGPSTFACTCRPKPKVTRLGHDPERPTIAVRVDARGDQFTTARTAGLGFSYVWQRVARGYGGRLRLAVVRCVDPVALVHQWMGSRTLTESRFTV